MARKLWIGTKMAKENPMAIPGGGGGLRARIAGGIKGSAGKNVKPLYKASTSNVKVIKAGSKPLTQKTREASALNEEARISAAAKRLEKIRQSSGYNWSE